MDFMKILQIIIKAPTLFIYSIYVWGTKIDSHKMFKTCMFQELLVILVTVTYATTPGSAKIGIYLLIVACVVSLMINYILCGTPIHKSDWIYVLTGKDIDRRMQSEQQMPIPEQQDVTEQQCYYEQDIPEQIYGYDVQDDANQYPLTSEEYENIADRIIVEDDAAVTEDKVEEEEYTTTMESLSEDLGVDIDLYNDESDLTSEDVIDTSVNVPEPVTEHVVESAPVQEPVKEEPQMTATGKVLSFEEDTANLTEEQELNMEEKFRKSSVNYDIMEQTLKEQGIDDMGLNIPDEI